MENYNINSLTDLEARFKSVAVRIPAMAGNIVVNFTLDNFKRQGFLGDYLQPWRPRKNPTKWGKVPRNNRSVLVDTGKLRRATFVQSANWDVVTITNNMPYAKAHNEGFRGTVKQYVKPFTRKTSTIAKVSSVKSRRTTSKRVSTGNTQVKGFERTINQNIPQRKFLGDSPYLRKMLERTIAAEILKELKQQTF
ncbi:MAG: phage virion morphogenesis protein [Bacteroidetes bacterium]|nr:phage virion morphogenesis protein [Bacteroidota bacterium]